MPAASTPLSEYTRITMQLSHWCLIHDRHPIRYEVAEALQEYWWMIGEICLFIDAFHRSHRRSLSGGKMSVVEQRRISKTTALKWIRRLGLKTADFQEPDVTTYELMNRSEPMKLLFQKLEAFHQQLGKEGSWIALDLAPPKPRSPEENEAHAHL